MNTPTTGGSKPTPFGQLNVGGSDTICRTPFNWALSFSAMSPEMLLKLEILQQFYTLMDECKKKLGTGLLSATCVQVEG